MAMSVTATDHLKEVDEVFLKQFGLSHHWEHNICG